jgi:hypothetical protein
MTLGSTFTPTCWQITTNGDDAAVEPPIATALNRSEECWLMLRPIMSTVRR